MAKYLLLLLILNVISGCVDGYLEWDSWDKPNALDVDMLHNALDPELCREQLEDISSNILLTSRFLDAGLRMPKGILEGNLVDLGNYYQCLRIEEDTGTSIVQGKYCAITVGLPQNGLQQTPLRDFPWPQLPNMTRVLERQIHDFESYRSNVLTLSGSHDHFRVSDISALAGVSLTLAVCIPKTCTTQQALETLYLNLLPGLQYSDKYCRLANDKPFVPADYAAFVIFGLLGIVTLLSTAYDVRHSVLLKRDPKSANTLYQSFSVYTNARRLTTYTSTPKTIECLDGIRVLAMMWVIFGHSYSNNMQSYIANPLDVLEWHQSFHSVLITAAPISVDTFFLLSGLLIVYTTAGKLKRMSLVKNIHLFYLNRLLRMFPILAAGVLLMASWFNHVADGPNWQPMIRKVHNCRTFWWSTLLHVQNYMNASYMCLGHTWYLAVDTQLHILSPVILFWVLTSKRAAWVSLSSALVICLTVTTIYNAFHNFQGGALAQNVTPEANIRYNRYYYINTLTRAAPFFVGMMFGYILHTSRTQKIHVKRHLLTLFWALWAGIVAFVFCIAYPLQQPYWDNDTANLLINSFMRPLWGLAVGWMIFACANGYGGPVNWFLTLNVWKIPSRLSYAMYIFHYPLIYMMNQTAQVPLHFSDKAILFRYFADLSLAFFVAFLATLLVDSPFSTLIKMMIGGAKSPTKTLTNTDVTHNGNGVNQYNSHEIKTKL